MKSATMPSLRVEPEFRRKAERLLAPGQSLSSLLESLLREGVEARFNQVEFIDRALAGAREADREKSWRDADHVLAKLGASLRRTKGPRRRSRA